jgi:hypothetical protein
VASCGDPGRTQGEDEVADKMLPVRPRRSVSIAFFDFALCRDRRGGLPGCDPLSFVLGCHLVSITMARRRPVGCAQRLKSKPPLPADVFLEKVPGAWMGRFLVLLVAARPNTRRMLAKDGRPGRS